MGILVSASQLRKAFGAKNLFEGLTFSVFEGERIGLIGPNGVGKSTLMKIIAGRDTQDSGQLVRTRGLRVGFLEQEPALDGAKTIQETLEAGIDLHDWEALQRAEEVRTRFGLDGALKVGELSGGWRKRVALAREILRAPDLLLLDEPTNHLDVEAIRWLEDFLRESRFALVTVTHDRLFLDRVANRIIEIHPRNAGGILRVEGGYADYLETRDSLVAEQQSREGSLRNTLRRETEWLRRGAKARTTKQQARISRAYDLEDEVADLASRNKVSTVRLDFGTSTDAGPKRLLAAEKISKSFEGRPVVPPLDLVITPKTRLGLLGKNGSGKSTLIRLLLGRETPDTGSVQQSERIKVAYFEQDRSSLDASLTVLRTLCPTGETVEYRGNRISVRGYLGRFLFSTSQMETRVEKLSGGEQARLLMARLMLQDANLLVLDEPTNDLDLATLDVLQEALESFPGAVILVTHDRYFLDQVSSELLAFEKKPDGSPQVLSFADYYQWERWKEREREELESAQKNARNQGASVGSPSGAGASAPKKKLSFKEQKEYSEMEGRIAALEKELAALTESSGDSRVLSDPSKLREVTMQMQEKQEQLDSLFTRWSELEERAKS